MNTHTNRTTQSEQHPLKASLPTSYARRIQRADAFLQAGLVIEAKEMYEDILNECDSSHARYGLSRCAYIRRDLHEALGHLQALARIEPNFPGAENDLGVVYFELGLKDAAHQQLLRIAERSPNDPLPWRNLLDVALAIGDAVLARDYCQRILALRPDDSEIQEILEKLSVA